MEVKSPQRPLCPQKPDNQRDVSPEIRESRPKADKNIDHRSNSNSLNRENRSRHREDYRKGERVRDDDREKRRSLELDKTRERNRECDRDRNHDRDRDRERNRDRNRDKERYREKDRYKEKDRSIDYDRELDRDRNKDRHREKDRDRDRDCDRDRDRDRDNDRRKDRDHRSGRRESPRDKRSRRRHRSRSNESSASSDYIPDFLKSESEDSSKRPHKKNKDRFYVNIDEQVQKQHRKYAPIHGESGPARTELYWDGYFWLPKSAGMRNVDPNFLAQTKKVRRIQLMNLPLYLSLSKEDIQNLLNTFFLEHYLNDKGSRTPVISVEISSNGKSVIIELSSVEEANRLAKLEHITILEVKCKVSRCSESQYNTESTLAAKLETARNQAEATGIVMKAMDQMLYLNNVMDNFDNLTQNYPCRLISSDHEHTQSFKLDRPFHRQTPLQKQLRKTPPGCFQGSKCLHNCSKLLHRYHKHRLHWRRNRVSFPRSGRRKRS